MCEKACSGREESTVKGLDMTVRLAGGVDGEPLWPPLCELLVEMPEAATQKKQQKLAPLAVFISTAKGTETSTSSGIYFRSKRNRNQHL